MPANAYSVMFLCDTNSARSLMAEAILKRESAGRFNVYSCGSRPKMTPHRDTIDLLARLNHDVADLRPKSWSRFAEAGAPPLDFCFALSETLPPTHWPHWKGAPVISFWPVPDPEEIPARGAEHGLMLAEIYRMLESRISIFANLRLDALDRLALSKHLDDIGSSPNWPAEEHP
jgi:arsenate reductase